MNISQRHRCATEYHDFLSYLNYSPLADVCRFWRWLDAAGPRDAVWV